MLKRPQAESVPNAPGSYQFLDKTGKVLYVGKAKSLRKRLASYFKDPKKLETKTLQMLQEAENLEWVSVATEVEALMLEYNLIQRYRPRFNVRYRDDKSYPYLAVTLKEEFPRPVVVRGKHQVQNRYFGPYAHAYAIRETVDLLLKAFPLRTCSNNKYRQHLQLKKPCLLYHIDKCSGPCAGEIEPAEYSKLVEEFVNFMEGKTESAIKRLEQKMKKHVEELNFEMAARVRDKLASVQRVIESQQMVGSRMEDFDVINWVDGELEAAVQIFFIRKGRVMGRRGFILDKAEPLTSEELAGRILEGIYFEKNPLGPPKRIYLPVLPKNLELYANWLSDMRKSTVVISIPQRGDKRQLAQTVRQNAEESLLRYSLKRAQDHNSRSKALSELQKYLGLPSAPLRIECYDTSHISGTDYVGSMVVAEDGLLKKQDYRHFVLRDVKQNDDYSAMYELLHRRFANYKKGSHTAGESFSYPPSLLLIDGGKGQLSVAQQVLREFKLTEEIPAAALAKELEELFLPGKRTSLKIPRQSEALYLLQRIRDESHRFAVSHHRKRRSSRMKESFLDGIAGLGPERKKRLLKEMKSVKHIRAAELKELESLNWLPRPVAQAIYEKSRIKI